MFEKEAQRSFAELDDRGVGDDWSIEESYVNGFSNGAVLGYNKANEWHDLKTEKPPLRKEVLWCIDNQLWLGQLCESWIDFGEWDIDSVLFNDHEIAWKEIVLP